MALSTAAGAQVMGLTGVYAEGALGVRANTTEINETGVVGSGDVGKRGILGSLRAGWRGYMPQVNFGASIFFNPAEDNAGNLTLAGTGGRLRQDNHWGIGADVGWRIATSTTMYARLDWHRARFRLRSDNPLLGETRRHHGWGYGFGVRHMIDPNTYVFAEWQQVEFERKRYAGGLARMEPANTFGLIGAGINF